MILWKVSNLWLWKVSTPGLLGLLYIKKVKKKNKSNQMVWELQCMLLFAPLSEWLWMGHIQAIDWVLEEFPMRPWTPRGLCSPLNQHCWAQIDHYIQVLSCKQNCVTELASHPSREKPFEDFLPSHYNYLQFAYYNSKACFPLSWQLLTRKPKAR